MKDFKLSEEGSGKTVTFSIVSINLIRWEISLNLGFTSIEEKKIINRT